MALTFSFNQQGSEAAIPPLLIYGPAWSGLGRRMLDHACRLLSSAAAPDPTMLVLHTFCMRDPRCGVRPFPAQWAIGPTPQAGCEGDIARSSPTQAVSPQLHGIFSWQAQLRSRPDGDPCWNEGAGSALAAVKTRVEEVLDTMPLGQGNDLFPGPGYADHAELRRRRQGN